MVLPDLVVAGGIVHRPTDHSHGEPSLFGCRGGPAVQLDGMGVEVPNQYAEDLVDQGLVDTR